jgi:hypothetical protein
MPLKGEKFLNQMSNYKLVKNCTMKLLKLLHMKAVLEIKGIYVRLVCVCVTSVPSLLVDFVEFTAHSIDAGHV